LKGNQPINQKKKNLSIDPDGTNSFHYDKEAKESNKYKKLKDAKEFSKT
jgi:hypothetical protein